MIRGGTYAQSEGFRLSAVSNETTSVQTDIIVFIRDVLEYI